MFTGIVETVGIIEETREVACGRRISVSIGRPVASDVKLGDSICISGVCLTVAANSGSHIEFDVVPETLACTTLGLKTRGYRVNIERSLRAMDRVDGHFVQGHVDSKARVVSIRSGNAGHIVRFQADAGIESLLIPKGSISIDGVSLTVIDVDAPLFSVALIPTTLSRTTLGELHDGDAVNIETDMVVRAVVHRLNLMESGAFLSAAKLQEAGFA